MLTFVLITVAGFGLVLLVVLELMREIVILRSEVGALRALLEPPVATSIGRSIELDTTWALPDDWIIMVFVSPACPACAELDLRIKDLTSDAPEVHRRLVYVSSDGSSGSEEVAWPAEERPTAAIHTSTVVRMDPAGLFNRLSVTATPTMVLLERDGSDWVAKDAVVGADFEWLRSQVQSRVLLESRLADPVVAR